MKASKINITKAMQLFDKYYYSSDLIVAYKKNREIIVSIISAFFNIQKNKSIIDADLSIIEKGLCHSWEVVFFDCAGKYTMKLSSEFPILNQLIDKLSRNKKSSIRKNMIILSKLLHDEKLKTQIIHNGLFDKSKVCRTFAIEGLLELPKRRANIEIRNVMEQKTEDDVQKRLKQIYDIINKGYSIEDMGSYVVVHFRKHALGIDKDEYSTLTHKEILSRENDN